MSDCVVWSTPGLIPLESFQTFGVNAKPNSTNPFGYFGTGLKIAIAVCLRMEQKVVLWRGRDKYTFYTNTTDFRGKQFDFVRMKIEKWTVLGALGRPKYIALPFTTELGKNWELWQAFREFETNTRDEGGETYISGASSFALENLTVIAVYGSRMIDEYHDRHRNFLPDGKVLREDEGIQVINRPSKHVYYRGVRVMDLKEEAAFTYNFLSTVELTEDRTAKYPYMLEADIVRMISESEDEELVRGAVGASRGYESTLYYGYASPGPSVSAVFKVEAAKSPNASAKQLFDQMQPQVPSTTTLLITVPKSEVDEAEMGAILEFVQDLFGEDVTVRNNNTREEVQF